MTAMRARRLELLAGAWLVAQAGLSPTLAWASDENPLIYVQASAVHDSNLYRLSSAAQADDYRSLMVGAKGRMFLGRQQLAGELSASQTRFSHFSQLDYSGYDGKVDWLYQAGNALSGSVGCQKKQTLTSLVDRSVGDKSLTTRQDCSAGFRLSPSGLWTWGGTFNRMTNDNDHQADYRYAEDQFDTYLSRFMKGENSLQGYYSLTRIASRSATTSDHYRQQQLGLRGGYRISSDTQTNFRIGLLERQVPSAPQRDFSVLMGNVGGSWQATSDTLLKASVYRNVGAAFELNANDLVVDGLSLSATWQATGKLSVSLQALTEQRKYQDDPGFIPGTLQRRDSFTSSTLSATYMFSRKGSLSAAYSHEQRGSNMSAYRYKDDVLQLSAFLAI